MLRDVVTAIDGFATWPCDEIPGIWLHGNLDKPTDSLTGADATPEIAGFIRARFAAFERRSGSTVVEKTCATSLRMPFVDAIFPDAKYIFIVRHGLDATASAMKRWTGSTSLGYLARKARWTPLTDLPRFVWRTVRTRLQSRSDGALTTWGPRFEGMTEMAANGPLHDVCAEQWRRCVDDAADYLDLLPDGRVLRLRYEAVTRDPGRALTQIADFLGVAEPDLSDHAAFAGVSPASIGKSAGTLTADQTQAVLDRIQPTLQRLGYGDTP
jgi:hypothetical protein